MTYSESSKNDKWLTRQTLLLRLKNRCDEQAWKEFESYYRRYLYNILRQMKISPEDAEDISQLVQVKLWEKLPDFNLDKSRGKFRSWLATVVRNQAIDFLEKNNRYRHEELPQSGLTAGQNEIEKIIDSEWQRTIMEKAWDITKQAFEEKTLKAFELSTSGMQAPDIAAKLGIAEPSVYTFKSRVKDRLKREARRLNDEFG